MTETSSWQFGLIVAYVLPGFVGLAGLAPVFPSVAGWLKAGSQGLDLGPPTYAILSATCIGLILSCFRWLILDRIHEWTGVERPDWDDRQLVASLGAFDYLVQNHFRYYEFSGNTLMAIALSYGVNRWTDSLSFLGTRTDLAFILVSLVLFAASRDALSKYYTRTQQLLGPIAIQDFGGSGMYNGNDHGGTSSREDDKKRAEKPKPVSKPDSNDPNEGTAKAEQSR